MAKDLIIGATYLTKDNEEYVYMGRFDKYEYCYWKNGHYFKTKEKMEEWCKENNISKISVNNGIYGLKQYEEDEYKPTCIGKQYCFCYKRKLSGNIFINCFHWRSSISKILIHTLNKKCCENYSDLFYLLEGTAPYSPIDNTKEKYFPMSYNEFFNKATITLNDNSIIYKDIIFMAKRKTKISKYDIRKSNENKGKYFVYKYSRNNIYYNGNIEAIDIFPFEEKHIKNGCFGDKIEKHMVPVTLKEIFDTLCPMYKQVYLKNGREYKKEYTL